MKKVVIANFLLYSRNLTKSNFTIQYTGPPAIAGLTKYPWQPAMCAAGRWARVRYSNLKLGSRRRCRLKYSRIINCGITPSDTRFWCEMLTPGRGISLKQVKTQKRKKNKPFGTPVVPLL